jgi:hypothetical protein
LAQGTATARRLRIVGTISEQRAVRVTGGQRVRLEPAIDYAPRRPPIYGRTDRWPVLEARIPPRLPPTRVLELPGARVWGDTGWVMVRGRAITSLTWWESMTYANPRLDKLYCTEVRRVPGTLLTLATMRGAFNYSHFLLDGLGRLAVTDLAGIGMDDVDWVLVPGLDTEGARRMLDALGVPPHKRLVPTRRVAIAPDVVIAPSLPGTTRVYRPLLPRFMRTHVPPSDRTLSRIYVTRPLNSRRPLANAVAVEKLITEHGFTTVDPMQENLAALLRRADVVIGEHGAALADLTCCRPGAHVIELVPSDHMQPYYFSVALAAGLSYAAVVCNSLDDRHIDEWGPSPHPVEVPLPALRKALAALPR